MDAVPTNSSTSGHSFCGKGCKEVPFTISCAVIYKALHFKSCRTLLSRNLCILTFPKLKIDKEAAAKQK